MPNQPERCFGTSRGENGIPPRRSETSFNIKNKREEEEEKTFVRT